MPLNTSPLPAVASPAFRESFTVISPCGYTMTLWNFLATQMPDDGPMRLEIVQETGKSNVESQEMTDAMRALGHACEVSDPVHWPLNHFVARVIVENKRCLAFMQDPRHRDLFSVEELPLVAQICPWAAICDDAIEVTWRGTTGPLRDLLIENKDAFVLKQSFDICGDGVSIGKDCSESDWSTLIDQSFNFRHTIQEYIPPCSFRFSRATTVGFRSQ